MNTSTPNNDSPMSYRSMNLDSKILQIEDGVGPANHSPTGNNIELDLHSPRSVSDGTVSLNSPPPTAMESLKNYATNPYFVTELFICIFVAAIGHFAPDKIFRLKLNERDIPYQTNENGDIILDQYLNRPMVEKETVPDWMLVLISMISPFMIIVVVGSRSKVRYDIHSGACAFLFALGSCEFITSFVKLYAGYFRPNFYSYCGFSEDTLTCDSDSLDPRKSFPSGHASSSFCGMTMLTLVFLGKIGLHSITSYGTCRIIGGIERNTIKDCFKKRLLSAIALLPMLIAIFIAASRVHDNMHHPADIAAGAMIGMSSAIFGYGLWYPSIYSAYAGYPLQTVLSDLQ